MTTSQSPLRVLKTQASNMARIMTAIERGEKGPKMSAASLRRRWPSASPRSRSRWTTR
ncbi:hypothetical protein ABIF63_004832 [Bradyrhizobium japonicum]|uniref:Uncharacterized protein n=1 Tax=Bradyrhizobium japonicum TaxID=375 RepID=A0ABV2RUZ2_BRAJP